MKNNAAQPTLVPDPAQAQGEKTDSEKNFPGWWGGWMIGSDYYNINTAPFEPGLWLGLENECSIALFGAWSHPIRAGARLNKIFPGGLIVSCEWLVFGVGCWVVGSDKIKANSAHLQLGLGLSLAVQNLFARFFLNNKEEKDKVTQFE